VRSQRSKIKASGGEGTTESTCHSFQLQHFASRHPVKATLRLAPLGLDRDPSPCREPSQKKEWQILMLAEALLNFSLDIGQPSHGRPVKRLAATFAFAGSSALLCCLLQALFQEHFAIDCSKTLLTAASAQRQSVLLLPPPTH
jgi:hypothetical protein